MIPKNCSEADFRYGALPVEYLTQAVANFEMNFEKCRVLMSSLLENYGEKIRINIPMIYRITERIDQRKDYYLYFHSNSQHAMRMSQAKEAALFSYWFLKYKPLSFEEAYDDAKFFEENSYTLNELYIAYFLMTFIVGIDEDNQKFFSKNAVSTLTYSLTNREISKESLILYVESFLTENLNTEGKI